MPYPRRLLNDNETITLDIHPHWWYFAGPVSILLVLVVLAGVVLSKLDGGAETAFSYLFLVAILIAVAYLVVTFTKWATTNFVVTSHRIIFREGVLSRRGTEITLEKVNNLAFHQSLIERLLGAGDLLIESGGETGQETFTDIRSPEQVQKIIQGALQQYLEQSRNSHMAPSINNHMNAADEIAKLADLRDRGVLSDTEFENQKRRILGD